VELDLRRASKHLDGPRFGAALSLSRLSIRPARGKPPAALSFRTRFDATAQSRPGLLASEDCRLRVRPAAMRLRFRESRPTRSLSLADLGEADRAPNAGPPAFFP